MALLQRAKLASVPGSSSAGPRDIEAENGVTHLVVEKRLKPARALRLPHLPGDYDAPRSQIAGSEGAFLITGAPDYRVVIYIGAAREESTPQIEPLPGERRVALCGGSRSAQDRGRPRRRLALLQQPTETVAENRKLQEL